MKKRRRRRTLNKEKINDGPEGRVLPLVTNG